MASQIVEKKTRGQQKIKMQRIENETARIITFSKRRKGLFSKASALATLTGAEVAVMVVSPGGRIFGFGTPNVQSVVERFLCGGHRAPPQNSFDVLGSLHAQLGRVVAQVEAENERAKELKRKREYLEARFWMAAPYDRLSPTQLMQVKARLVEMSQQLTRLPIYNNNNNNSPAVNPTHRQFYSGVPLPPARGIPLRQPPMPMMSRGLTRRVDRRVPFYNHNNNNNNNFPAVNPTHHRFYAGMPQPPARGIPLQPTPTPMMPPMPRVTHQNQALGGNMMMPPPPYDRRWNNMGGNGGPPGGFY